MQIICNYGPNSWNKYSAQIHLEHDPKSFQTEIPGQNEPIGKNVPSLISMG